MPIIDKIKEAAARTKTFVVEHKQAVFNGVMLVGMTGAAAALYVLHKSLDEVDQATRDSVGMLADRQDYARDRIYKIERSVGMPVHKHDQRHHDYLQSLEADPDKQ